MMCFMSGSTFVVPNKGIKFWLAYVNKLCVIKSLKNLLICHHSFLAIICSAHAIQQSIGHYIHIAVSMRVCMHVFCEHAHAFSYTCTPARMRTHTHTTFTYIYIDKIAPNSVLYYAGQQKARNSVLYRCLSIQ